MIDQLPSCLMRKLMRHLNIKDKRSLYATSKGMRDLVIPTIRRIVIEIPLNQEQARAAGRMLFLPNQPALAPTGITLTLRGEPTIYSVATFLHEASNNRHLWCHLQEVELHEVEPLRFKIDGSVGQALTAALGTCRLRLLSVPSCLPSFWTTCHIEGVQGLTICKGPLLDCSLKNFQDLTSLSAPSLRDFRTLEEVPGRWAMEQFAPLSQLKKLDLDGANLCQGAVEAVLTCLPHLAHFKVGKLEPRSDLSAAICSWRHLTMRVYDLRFLAWLPLHQLQHLGVQMLRSESCPMILDKSTSPEHMEQSVLNLVRCPGVTNMTIMLICAAGTQPSDLGLAHFEALRPLWEKVKGLELHVDDRWARVVRQRLRHSAGTSLHGLRFKWVDGYGCSFDDWVMDFFN